MTHAWIDASAGVAGDMLLGALLDAGADLVKVQDAVDAVAPDSVRVASEVVTRAGMRATKAHVRVLVQDPPHRTWRSIRESLTHAALDEGVRDRATAVFLRLAEAEAHAHGIEPDDVHFHEVGALDSIADVVGVCAALADLEVETVSAGPISVGSGSIRVAHGVMAVPGPAVTELSRGWQVAAGGEGELATPTGVALVVALAHANEPLPSMTLQGSGTGAGTRDVAGRPNVTRVLLGQRAVASVAEPSSAAGLEAVVLEANVDDLDPRLWPGVLSALLTAGADDAWLVPILMKKGRPAHTLRVLADPARATDLRDVIFRLTSTFGVRENRWTKYALDRTWFEVDVDGRPVLVKVAHRDGVIVQAMPEFESVAQVARTLGLGERDVLDRARSAADRAGLAAGRTLDSAGGGARPTSRSASEVLERA